MARLTNLLALAVLSYLSWRPMHPYELSKLLREHGKDRSVKFRYGSLYAVIEQLVRAGFVTQKETSRHGQRPERTVYAATERGRNEASKWLREIIAKPAFEYPTFVTGLAFIATVPPDEAVPLLEQRMEHLAKDRTELKGGVSAAEKAGVHPIHLVEEEYRVALIDAEIKFVRHLLQRITDKKTQWFKEWAAHHKQARSQRGG